MSGKDEIFKKKINNIERFCFDENVANVFDDMVSRSVPFYGESLRIVRDLTKRFYIDGAIYDLGCSTGSTFNELVQLFIDENKLPPSLIGIDNSKSMLKKCQQKLAKYQLKSLELHEQDLRESRIENAGMVVMNYTLQFIPQEDRNKLLSKIYQGLKSGGIFVLSEKIISPKPKIDSILTDLYYDFKRRNGYSELEISQKREALENVLTPLTPKLQLEQLHAAGFENCEMIFRWYNFATYIGIKP